MLFFLWVKNVFDVSNNLQSFTFAEKWIFDPSNLRKSK
jgi:hypothetical protein